MAHHCSHVPYLQQHVIHTHQICQNFILNHMISPHCTWIIENHWSISPSTCHRLMHGRTRAPKRLLKPSGSIKIWPFWNQWNWLILLLRRWHAKQSSCGSIAGRRRYSNGAVRSWHLPLLLWGLLKLSVVLACQHCQRKSHHLLLLQFCHLQKWQRGLAGRQLPSKPVTPKSFTRSNNTIKHSRNMQHLHMRGRKQRGGKAVCQQGWWQRLFGMSSRSICTPERSRRKWRMTQLAFCCSGMGQRALFQSIISIISASPFRLYMH